jgi:hypothetical protein
MVGRYSQRSKGPDPKTIGGIALTILAVALVIGGFVLLQQKRNAVASLDPKTFCPKAGPAAVHAVLIDRTDALTDLQLEALNQDVLHWAQDVPKHAAFRIYEVGVGGAILKPVVDVCNPGDGSDASIIDSNPAALKRRYIKTFLGPVQAMLTAMRADETKDTSPIMEAVQAISVRNFGETGATGDNALIIVSDLLQHSDRLSLYKAVPSNDDFEKGAAGRSLHADLSGVAVTIYLINRIKDARFQSDNVGQFWIHWLEHQGAAMNGFKILPG